MQDAIFVSPIKPKHMSEGSPLSDNVLTRFERATLIGIRAEMLARGCPCLVPLADEMMRHGAYDPKLIAQAELAAGVMPFRLRRQHPDGRVVHLSTMHDQPVTQ